MENRLEYWINILYPGLFFLQVTLFQTQQSS